MSDLEWDLDIRPYCLGVYEQEPGDLSMQKLSELDRLLSARDADFLEQVRVYGDAHRRLKDAQETCHKAFQECEDAFRNYLSAQDICERASYNSDEYKDCLKSFGRAVSRNFGKNLLSSRSYTDTVAKYERETTQLNALRTDIEKSAEYVQKFAERYQKRRLKKRKALETELVTAQHEMLAAAKKKYPDLDLTKFALAVDSDSYWLDMGTTPAFPMEASHIPEGQTDSKLESIRDHYIEMHSQVEAGEAWIERLMIVPENAELPLQDALDEMKEKTRNAANTAADAMWDTLMSVAPDWARDDFMAAACDRYRWGVSEFPNPLETENPVLWQARFEALAADLSTGADWVQQMLTVMMDPAQQDSLCDLSEKLRDEIPKWKARNSNFTTNLTDVTEADILNGYRYCYGERDREGQATGEELEDILDSLTKDHLPLVMAAHTNAGHRQRKQGEDMDYILLQKSIAEISVRVDVRYDNGTERDQYYTTQTDLGIPLNKLPVDVWHALIECAEQDD